ncbi:hypothetical protein pb186bvf_008169 [Paramecium bursaria]
MLRQSMLRHSLSQRIKYYKRSQKILIKNQLWVMLKMLKNQIDLVVSVQIPEMLETTAL